MTTQLSTDQVIDRRALPAQIDQAVIGLIAAIGVAAFGVYAVLIGEASKGSACDPSIKELSRATNLSDNSVRNALAVLERHQLIAITRRPPTDDNPLNQTNIYTLLTVPQPVRGGTSTAEVPQDLKTLNTEDSKTPELSLTTFEIVEAPDLTTVKPKPPAAPVMPIPDPAPEPLPSFSEALKIPGNDRPVFHPAPQYRTPANGNGNTVTGDCWRCQGTGLAIIGKGDEILCPVCHGVKNRPALDVGLIIPDNQESRVKPAPPISRHRALYVTGPDGITAHYKHATAMKAARCGLKLADHPGVYDPPGPWMMCPECKRLAVPPPRDALFDAVGEHGFGLLTKEARAALASTITAAGTRLLLLHGHKDARACPDLIRALVDKLPRFGKAWQETGLDWFSNPERFVNQFRLWEENGEAIRVTPPPTMPKEREVKFIQNPDGPGLIQVWE